jgi:hypothetical protein
MHTNMVVRVLAAALFSVGMATTGVVAGVPGVADADVCPTSAGDISPNYAIGEWVPTTGIDRDDDDAGSISVWAKLRQHCFPQNYYLAEFRSHYEILRITDSYDDGRVPQVYLYVENNGTAMYVGAEDDNLDFREGLDVRIKLCIYGTSICTAYSPTGLT